MTLYFSKLALKRDPSVSSLSELINPTEDGERTDAHHRLLWTVFSDGPSRKRDFIWRSEPNGLFFTLSSRPPSRSGLFETPVYKEFSPALSRGDELVFVLRANAVKSLSASWEDTSLINKPRGKKVDVAMHLLHAIPGKMSLTQGEESKRAPVRYELAEHASLQWLIAQGERHGFSLITNRFVLNDYSSISLPKNRRKNTAGLTFGVFDMAGRLSVTDPEKFLSQLANGFGRAKAFGQGLMLIKRG